jgi:hypothetical protein
VWPEHYNISSGIAIFSANTIFAVFAHSCQLDLRKPGLRCVWVTVLLAAMLFLWLFPTRSGRSSGGFLLTIVGMVGVLIGGL